MKLIRLLVQLLLMTISGKLNTLHAQDPRLADSLRSELAHFPKRDTGYLDLSNKLASALLYVSPNGEALALAKASMQLADSLHDTLRLAKATNIAANCYKNSNLNDKAMQHYFRALMLFEAIDDQKWIANMHSNIGVMYMNKGDYEQSKKEQEMALAIRKRIHYYKGISGVYNGIGNIYDQLEKPQESLRFYQLALDSAGSGSPYDRAIFLGNIGNAYGRLKQYEISRRINQEALLLHRQMGLQQDISRDLHNIGESYLQQKKLDSAAYYLELAFKTADSVDYHLVKAISAHNLQDNFKQIGQFESALRWSEIAFQEYDTLHQLQLSGESQAQEVSYRVQQEEREAAFEQETTMLQKDGALKRQRIINWAMAFGLVLVGGFGFVVSKRYREKKHANALLEEKVAERTAALKESNGQLVGEIEQKEKASKTLQTFIYRSSHDLKGPLTSIKGLVNVAQEEGVSSTYIDHIGAKANQLDSVLQQLIDKVEVDARIPSPQMIDWQQLWAEIISEVAHRPGFKDMEFETDFSEAGGFQADPLLLKIALRELIHNAIDFRGTSQKVEVNARMNRKGKAEFSVEDFGIGIPADQQAKVWEMFYRGNNASKGAGLGLYLVKEAATKMGAQVHLRSPSPNQMPRNDENAGIGTYVKLIWD